MTRKITLISFHLIAFIFFNNQSTNAQEPTFSQSELKLNGNDFAFGTTALMYGPDGRLYVAEYPTGTIKVMTIQRNGDADYEVTAVEILDGIQTMADHNDDGTLQSSVNRQVTGLTVAGTSSNPIVYVASSDVRIGSGEGGGNGDIGLDTNSGVITRFTWNGGSWNVVDLVRGLPRSEENHSTNGLEFTTINGTDYLIVASGGFTNAGGPSTNFVYSCEYALSGAVLSIDLDAINALPILSDNGRSYIYDLPTLDDPTRANLNGITDPDNSNYDGIDVNDPFGGNDGLNQAIVVQGGPVQIFSPGFRNAYDLVVTQNGGLYVTDNGANIGWGGFPVNEGGGSATNDYDPSEPGSQSDSGGEQIDNVDHLQLVTTNLQTYVPGSLYGGHPNPTRANPNGAGLYTAPNQSGNSGAVFRTLKYDPDGSSPGSTNNPAVALPANWPPVQVANPVEGDWRGPTVNNPDGPQDNPVAIWGTNTNGIDEYTASNFGGVMQGDLLAGHNMGNIRRVQLNSNGTLQNLNQTFLTGIGGNALGITCNSDLDVFPGTIWAGTLNGKIVVFEPADAVICINPGEPGYVANEDYDSDGYTNQDEINSGVNHCNGGSQPMDFDKSAGFPLQSDLSDLDDDNDGINDALDPFQLGNPTLGGSDAFQLPVNNDLFNDQEGLGGIFGLGMTGLMNNGDTGANWLDWLDDRDEGPNPNDVLGGAPGLMTSHMTSGTAFGSSNTQEKGYQYGVQTSVNTGIFTVSGNLINLTGPLRLYGNNAAVGGELGLFIGDGTQSNYIKIVLTTNGITAVQEINDVPQTPLNVSIPIASRPSSSIVLYFIVNPSTGKVYMEYAIDGGARNLIGTITAQGNVLNAIQQANKDMAVGFIGTSNSPNVELEGTWDFLNVSQGDQGFAARVNVGGSEIISDGKLFLSDQSFTGGQQFSNSSAQVPQMYQTERSSSGKTFQYNFPVQNGDYNVILHFAEIYWGATGGGPGGIGNRIFDVNIEGSLKLDNYDIYAEVGAETVVTKSFGVTVNDGILNIDFSSLENVGGVDQPKVSAIEITQAIENNQPPVAVAQATPITGDAPLEVTFTGSNSTDDVGVASYLWDFKDTSPTVNEANPIHTFSAPGTYDVELTVGDGDGSMNTTTITIVVNDPGSPEDIRINSGGPLTTFNSKDWVSDEFFLGGSSFANANAQLPDLYKTERSSSSKLFQYNITLPNGNYEVRLHFAEIYWGATGGGTGGVGSRVFDVFAEGSILLDDYDIVADVGSETPVVKTFDVTILDGQLNLEFDTVGSDGVDQPKVSAIEVVSGGSFAPIVVQPISDQNNMVNDVIGSLGVSASGGDPNANFIYEISGQPDGIQIEPTNGLIYGTINSNSATGGINNDGVHNVTVSVSKLGSTTIDINFDWTITDSASCVWNDLSDPSQGRFESMTGVLGDKLYLIGGWLPGIPRLVASTEVEIYDIANDTWSFGTPMPVPITHMGFTAVGDELWSIGGFVGDDPGVATDAVLIYNTTTDTWSTGPNLPTVTGSGSATLNDNKLHFFGGLAADRQTDLGNHYVLDLNNIGAGWTTAAPLPNPRNHLSAASLNGLVYAIGGQYGHDGPKEDTKLLHVYDPSTDQWSKLADLPEERSHFEPATSIRNGKIIIAGGRNGGNFYDEVTQYDPQLNSWSELCTLPASLVAPVARIFGDRLIVTGGSLDGFNNIPNETSWLLLEPEVSQLAWVDKNENEDYTARHENSFVQAGDKFYLMGGRENAKTIDIYDYNSDSWTALVDSAPFEFNHFQATEYQGLIWVIGAFKTNNFPNEIPAEFIWTFDPANQEWIQGPQIPAARRRGSTGLVVHNDKFYIAGGNNSGHDGGYLPFFDEYDPSTGNWSILGDAPRARDHFASAVINNKLYLAGGRLTSVANGFFEPTISEVDVYDFNTATWSTLPSSQNIPTNRGAASVANFNNKLVVIGGEIGGQSSALTITEEFNPATGLWSELENLNFPRHGTQAIVSGNGIFITAGSPNQGGGNQKNMEVLGVDSPVGTPSLASTLTTPTSALVDDTSDTDISLDVNNGNTGIIIKSMQLSGPNASSFSITSGQLSNGLLKHNTSHDVSIGFNGTVDGEIATLVINYGNSNQVSIALEGNIEGVQNDIIDFTLINADADTDMLDLIDGTQISASTVQGIGLNIRANTSPPVVGSVAFQLSGELSISRTENAAAYALYGNSGNDYNSIQFPLGDYMLTAIAYSGSSLSGNILGEKTIQFSIVNEVGENNPPVVTNPGTQNSNEGDTISLPIVASDESNNLTYSATGLPPGLSMNSNTGIISGTVASGGTGNGFQESNGLVVIEAESGNLVPGWSQTSTGGATGIIASTNSFNSQSGGTIPYQINISTPGVYRFNWRNFYSGSSPTDENDNWLRFPNNNDVWFFGHKGTIANEAAMISNLQGAQNNIVFPKGSSRITPGTTPEGGGSNGFLKVYRAGGAPETYSWQALTSDGDGHDVYVWFVNPGTYTMEISERSAGHAIDKIALYKLDGQTYTTAQLTAAQESQSSGGPGASANSPYDVQVTVSDDAIPQLSTTTQFSWIVGVANVNNPPIAIPVASTLSGDAPLQVSFTGGNSTDDSGIVSYLWDFDDNSSSTQANPPTHTFNTPGIYNVTLTVTDGQGLSDSESLTIVVNDVSQNGVVGFTLVNADTNIDIFDLVDGQEIGVQTAALSIRANTDPAVVGSVSLVISGLLSNSRVENVAPYTLFGDYLDNYNGFQLQVGTYTISATAYSGANLSGTNLGTLTNQFTITNSSSNKSSIAISNQDLIGDYQIDMNFETMDIIVSPNPAKNYLRLDFLGTSGNVLGASLFNLNGKLVRTFNTNEINVSGNGLLLNIEGITNGIYLVKITLKDSDPRFIKAIVQN